MTADVIEVFDKIFEQDDFANFYLASLMSWSENKDDLQIKKRQVQLLRECFANQNSALSNKYLPILNDIERIIDKDGKQFACDAEPQNDKME